MKIGLFRTPSEIAETHDQHSYHLPPSLSSEERILEDLLCNRAQSAPADQTEIFHSVTPYIIEFAF